jgi:glycerophosphoryl diester phosphodiesterase
MGRLPLIIGHRGASALAPENSLAAFRRAIADGADGIEFDVRLSRDRVPVVIHDATLERTGLVRRKVGELTAAELQSTRIGNWFKQSRRRRGAADEDFTDERVPLLAQVLELFKANRGRLYLEMKADEGEGSDLVMQVVRMIQESAVRDRVVVECFDLGLIAAVKTRAASIRTAALFEPKLSRPSSFVRRDYSRQAADVGADEIALHHALANRRNIDEAIRLNQKVVLWTVDKPSWVAKARDWGIMALITNNPRVLLRARESSSV